MKTLSSLYRHNLALLTDLYQLTMSQAFWAEGMADGEAVYHLTFRQSPFGGQYAIAAGLQYVTEFLDGWHITSDDSEYLATLNGADGKPLFRPQFLEYITDVPFRCSVDAIPEGTVVFPHEPLVRVQGPIWQCQVIETALLNIVNFQTLIATKAARICRAAEGEPVLEFGLRRAQGIDGSLAASRAAIIGGCVATSNVLAGKLFNVGVRGTHAHSWVMAFDDEMNSFEAYARAMPNNCVFLVDTYDTLEGVRRAIEVGKKLELEGHRMLGVRLDSGDLSTLSRKSRALLDAAGMNDALIVASNDLDEYEITKLKSDGAAINCWGVGTRLATAYDQPALGGVYKLAAMRDESNEWEYRIKLSEQAIKVSNPGIQQVRRYSLEGQFVGDAIYDEPTGLNQESQILSGDGSHLFAPIGYAHEDLLVPVFREGKLGYDCPAIEAIQQRVADQLSQVPAGSLQLESPIGYPVGLENRLYRIKDTLIKNARRDRQ
ncbi:MAG: nicotinate phosphoribosyltransferase [Pirellulaceae bacterium]|jgi:nicotinate phosphoribosyltransferase